MPLKHYLNPVNLSNLSLYFGFVRKIDGNRIDMGMGVMEHINICSDPIGEEKRFSKIAYYLFSKSIRPFLEKLTTSLEKGRNLVYF